MLFPNHETEEPRARRGGQAPKLVKGVAVGRKRQITLTISPELLAQVDELAARIGHQPCAVRLALACSIRKPGCS